MDGAISGSQKIPEETRIPQQAHWALYRGGASDQQAQPPVHCLVYGYVYLRQLIRHGDIVPIRRQSL